MCVWIRGQKEIIVCMWVLYCKVMARAVVKVAASSKGMQCQETQGEMNCVRRNQEEQNRECRSRLHLWDSKGWDVFLVVKTWAKSISNLMDSKTISM